MCDLVAAIEYYTTTLRFAVDWDSSDDDYRPNCAQVSRGECRIVLREVCNARSPGAIQVEVEDMDALCSELVASHGLTEPRRPWRHVWGEQDLRVVDPFGNGLILVAPYEGEDHDDFGHGEEDTPGKMNLVAAEPILPWKADVAGLSKHDPASD